VIEGRRTVAALGDERRIYDLMDRVNTGITRQLFESVFRSVPYAEHLQSQVLEEHVRWFFKQADEFLRLRVAGKEIDEKLLVRDYERCRRLIKGTEKGLQQLRTFVQKYRLHGPSRTAPVARFILGNLTSLQSELTETFEETRRDIAVNERLRRMLHPKTGSYEFIGALDKYISYKFPGMQEADKAALIGAVKAGARLLPSAKLREDPVESLQTEMKRAKRHEKKQREGNPESSGSASRTGEKFRKRKNRTTKQKGRRRNQK
jgi:hypothetical protein